MATGSFVSYIRVSTAAQGRSGLGLEAQREAVSTYLNGGEWQLLKEFVEVETGKGSNALEKRPELRAAMAYAKKHRATLVIAKLDRLARNVHFISGLMEAGVEFVAADMPNADRFQLHLFAALAEQEARMISQRTKAALAAAKERGTVLGSNGRVLAVRYKAEAMERVQPFAAELLAMKGQGLTVRAMADALNARGIRPPGGAGWKPGNVHRALQRAAATRARA